MVALSKPSVAQPTPIPVQGGKAHLRQTGSSELPTEYQDEAAGKRPSHSPLMSASPAALPARKRQRSFQDAQSASIPQMTSPVKQEEDDAFVGPMGPPTAPMSTTEQGNNVKPETLARAASFPKSNLKSSLRMPTTSTLVAGLDSPSESDRRGMYSDYIQKALGEHARGRNATYDELVSQFKLPAEKGTNALPPVGLLQMLLHALSNAASRLDRRNHSALVNAILALPWATMGGDPFARVWTRFVCNLCSVRSEWISEVLARSIKGLSYRSDWRSLAHAATSSSSMRPTRRLIYARIHSLLKALLSLIPTLPTQLAPLVLKYFPNKGANKRCHVVYIQNILELCEYAPELQHKTLECVIGRCVEIDVEVQMELDDLEEAEANFQEAGIVDDGDESETGKEDPSGYADFLDKPLEDDSDSLSEGDSQSDGESGFSEIDSDFDEESDGRATRLGSKSTSHDPKRVAQVREVVDKLDAIMSTLFKHLEMLDNKYNLVSKGLLHLDLAPARAISLRNEQFNALLHIFSRSLLPTFKSRHVQFLLFWFSSLDRDFCDMFVGLLLGKAIYSGGDPDDAVDTSGQALDKSGNDVSAREEGTPVILRIAASSYVASLVSRASYISAEDVRTVMLTLVSFLEAHLDIHGGGSLGTAGQDQSPGLHALFYAICQACFYIFCFRWRDLQISAARPRDESEERFGHGTDQEDDDDDDEERNGTIPSAQWCEGMDIIKRAIMSRLNPLAHCSSTVVHQFAGVAQLTGFLYCWSIIESNSRNAKRLSITGNGTSSANNSTPGTPTGEVPVQSQLQRTGSLRSNGRASAQAVGLGSQPALQPTSIKAQHHEIDSFFPFDPFRLRCSTKWIEPLYREWADVAPEGMIDDDDEDDDDDGDEDDDDDENDDDDDGEGKDSKATDNRRLEGTFLIGKSADPSTASSLAIPGKSTHRHPKRAFKGNFLSPPNERGIRRPATSIAASCSTNDNDDTDESSSVAQSLEAMSISPAFRAQSDL